MRVAICTPVDFPSDHQFFGRDTGLLCRGFQSLGHDAFVVMPGDAKVETNPDVARVSYDSLCKSDWWRSMSLDLVVLYAWGDPVHLAVAESIRKAGIPLVQSLDTAGLPTPYGDIRSWWRCLIGMVTAPYPISQKFRLAMRGLRDWVPAAYECKRIRMLDTCDAVAAVSEPAKKSVAEYLCALGRPEIAERLIVVPHAVVSEMHFDDTIHAKKPKVLVVGRWLPEDRAQKDPEMTMTVLTQFLRERTDWTAEIVGRGSKKLALMIAKEAPSLRDRLTLTEAVPRTELVDRYRHSRILLCASRFESFHISSAEAVCCGCSIVVADHPLLCSTGWFTTKQSGTLAKQRSASSLTSALFEESGAWDSEKRNAVQISDAWKTILHSANVAKGIQQSLKLICNP